MKIDVTNSTVFHVEIDLSFTEARDIVVWVSSRNTSFVPDCLCKFISALDTAIDHAEERFNSDGN